MNPILSISIILSCLLVLVNGGCSSAKQSTQSSKSETTKIEDSGLDVSKYKTLPIKANKTYTLNSNWDLKGETYVIPEGVTLNSKGGVFKNGTLIGNDTKIDTKKPLFNMVSIKGYWNVPEISTSMFVDLDYINSLQDVIALSNPSVKNIIRIEEGVYQVSVAKSSGNALTIPSNTSLSIGGTIELVPNDFRGYTIMYLSGKNIHINGSGTIMGDKFTHKGDRGEWGMGVRFFNASNCSLRGITIKNCWGDCVYIGMNSVNISIDKCIFDNGRRQGISITSGKDITISDCVISNIQGTSPEFAIDIEPNDSDTISNVKIKGVCMENCGGGFTTKATGKDSSIENIIIEDCKVLGTVKFYAYRVRNVSGLTMQNCSGEFVGDETILFQHNENIVARDNIINQKNNKYKVQDCKNTIIDRVKR